MQLGPVLGIAIVLFAVSEILKRTVFKDNADMKAVIPYVCAILGALIGVGLFMYDPSIMGTNNLLEAVVIGAVSGLVATGAFQIYRQFLNLMATAKAVEDEVKSTGNVQVSDQDLEKLSQAAEVVSQSISSTGSKKTE